MIDRLPRSYLYVPGNAPEKLNKALGRSADALIIDLEDAVPWSEKEAARDAVVQWLRDADVVGEVEVWVRVNSGDLLLEDVRALANLPVLMGIALAKCEGLGDVQDAADLLTQLGDEVTLLMPLIETAGAVLDARQIAGGPRVRQLQIGEVDLAAELGVVPSADEHELDSIRSAIVLASTAAGISPPMAPVSRITTEAGLLEHSTRRLSRKGFVGRACIHPAQIPVVHRVFAPSAEDVEEANHVVELFETAAADGRGVVLDRSGKLIDLAVLKGAQRVLALANRKVAVGATP